MKSSSNPTILLSVTLAVVLWFGANWFEDDSRWLPAEPLAPVDMSLQPSRGDTPLWVNTDTLSCQEVEENLIDDVDAAQYCVTDDDCTLFDYGYPVQCMTSVSKAEITSLRIAYRNYEQSCAYRVYYDCPSGAMERQAVCRNNRCEVELQSLDPLKDETLQHLGIKDL